MPTIKYSNNPNSDTAFVIQDGGQKNRTVLTAEPAGTLQLSDSANVSTGYVTDEDGKKHKVNLVARLEGDIEFSDNPNSTKGYATVDGKKHRVVLTASLHGGGGSAPVIEELNVTPTTSAQTITAPRGTDGYSPVNVSAVTSAIDANIVAENIKKDVSILGVIGSYEGGLQNNTVLFNTDSYNKLTLPTSIITLNAEDLDANVLKGLYKSNTSLNGNINFDFLTKITGNNSLDSTFYGASTISTFSAANVELISGGGALQNFCRDCSTLTSVNLQSLQTISGSNALWYAFAGTNVSSVNLNSLQTISSDNGFGIAFWNCTNLTTMTFPALSSVTGNQAMYYAFGGCTSLTSLSFPALTSSSFGTRTNQFQDLIAGVTGCTIHFPSNLNPQSGSTVISSLTGYPNFSGTNTVLAFDLPATE